MDSLVGFFWRFSVRPLKLLPMKPGSMNDLREKERETKEEENADGGP